MDKLDDTTYLNMRRFHERNITGEKKKMDYDGKGFTTFQKSQGTDRLLRPRGGAGIFRKVCCIKTFPLKIITNENCTPSWQYMAIKKKPPPLQPRLEQVSSSILGH